VRSGAPSGAELLPAPLPPADPAADPASAGGGDAIPSEGEEEDIPGAAEDLEVEAPAGPRDLFAEAVSLRHLLTHMPKNPHCEACQRAKPQHKPHKRSLGLGPRPEKFGDEITADHIVAESDISQGIGGHREALVILDRATRWIECYPLKTKGWEDAHRAFVDFLGHG
jgi:hypothetical protein